MTNCCIDLMRGAGLPAHSGGGHNAGATSVCATEPLVVQGTAGIAGWPARLATPAPILPRL
jgi:hypothetical protein